MAVIGVILKALERQSDLLGKTLFSIFEVALSLASFLVIPILVAEGIGPVQALEVSAGYLKKTWGEQISSNFSLGLIFLLFYLIAIGVAFLFGFLFPIHGLSNFQTIMLTVLVFVSTIQAAQVALTGIFQTVLYVYAKNGTVPDFDNELLATSHHNKQVV